jgi:hypothetical protein
VFACHSQFAVGKHCYKGIIVIIIFKNVSIEIQQMWNMKYFVISVIIGATGTVIKGLKNIWKRYQESIQYILYKKKKLY